MAFVEAAHYAAIWNPDIKKAYQRRLKKSPTMVAKKAIANKLTRACYHMLKEKKMFDVKLAFGWTGFQAMRSKGVWLITRSSEYPSPELKFGLVKWPLRKLAETDFESFTLYQLAMQEYW